MKPRNKHFEILKILAVLVLFLIAAPQALSQTEEDPPEPVKQGVPPPPGLPIDFGISALIASGVILGAYHLRKKKEDD